MHFLFAISPQGRICSDTEQQCVHSSAKKNAKELSTHSILFCALWRPALIVILFSKGMLIPTSFVALLLYLPCKICATLLNPVDGERGQVDRNVNYECVMHFMGSWDKICPLL